jgi:hypothetical protein
MGWSLRTSQAAKAASNNIPPANGARVLGLVQPCSGASMIPYSRTTRPAVDSAAPTGSGRGAVGSLEVGTTARTASRVTATMGRLIRNTDPHQ